MQEVTDHNKGVIRQALKGLEILLEFANEKGTRIGRPDDAPTMIELKEKGDEVELRVYLNAKG